MATFNKDNNTVTITDVKAELRAMVTIVNRLTIQLKDRNLAGEKRAEALKSRKECLKNAIYLTASAIVHGVLESDMYGLLKVRATKKTFKEVADINAILAELMAQLAKERVVEGSEYSLTELAKLIESPYQYCSPVERAENGVPFVNGDSVVEVETVEGEVLVVDKTTGTAYTAAEAGDHPSTTDGPVKVSKLGAIKDTVVSAVVGGYTWSRNAVVTAFNFAWDTILLVASFIMGAIFTTGSYIYAGVAKSSSWVIGLFGKSKPDTIPQQSVQPEVPAGIQPAV